MMVRVALAALVLVAGISPYQEERIVVVTGDSVDESVKEVTITVDGNSRTSNDDDDQPRHIQNNVPEQERCSLWFARSTIPGGGMGMFAGRDYERNEDMMPQGDIVIPIVDVAYHQDGRLDHYLWDEYTWNGETLLMENEGYDINSASPGFGSAANSVLDLVNVEEYYPTQLHGSVGLHRSKDPGVGAFTYYHNRRSMATMDITAGQELFVSYGNSWFETRSDSLGALPLKGDYFRANSILNKFKQLELTYNATLPRVVKGLWNQFIATKPTNESRTMNALPDDPDDLERVKEMGVPRFKRLQATVDMDYLYQNGTCASYLEVHPSTLPQAGRGAFARRSFAPGNVVAPVPLIHLVGGKLQMEMYELKKHKKSEYVAYNRSHVVGHQLLLNYCFGHGDSTLLLCPYGLQTNFVNHHATRHNVRLKWADPYRSNHVPLWLHNKSLNDLKKHNSAVLAFEFVATRDIAEGDEILLDYGDAWQQAWDAHVANWKPHFGSYKAAHEYNTDKQSPLKTTFEELTDPFPDNVEKKCHSIFFVSKVWKRVLAKNRSLDNYLENSDDDELAECDITARVENSNGVFTYTAVYEEKEDNNETRAIRVQDLPRETFFFVDKVGTTDIHLKNAFRHEARIPDDMFPEHWKNDRKQQEEEAKEEHTN